MANTVLVTGAGGFVGSAVVRLLVRALRQDSVRFSDGSPVEHVVAVLRPAGSRERLEELGDPAEWSIEAADLTDREELTSLLRRTRPRAVLHLAMDRRGHRALSAADRYRLNVAPLEVLFESLKEIPGARLIHTSSAWVLPSGDRLDESVSVEPRVPYAEHKVQGEATLPALHEQTRVEWINLRLFYMFGKYEDPTRLLPYLVSCLTQGKVAELSDGDQVRDFSDVDDIARAYLMALQADDSACGKTYHIGSGRGMTLRDFALTVAEVTGHADLIRFGARATQDGYLACQVADPTRAQRVLGWSSTEGLDARIHRTAEWWLDHGESKVPAVTS